MARVSKDDAAMPMSFHSPIRLPSRLKLLIRQIQEWLSDERASNVVDGCRQVSLETFFLPDFLKGGFDTCTVRGITGDTYGSATGCVDLLGQIFVIGWVAGQKSYSIAFGKPSRH